LIARLTVQMTDPIWDWLYALEIVNLVDTVTMRPPSAIALVFKAIRRATI
jgi:hypothetical protein